MRKPYTTDLSDAEWVRLRSYLPPTPKAGERPRTHSLRDVLDAIFFYVLKSGCTWRLLPHDFPPWSTVYYHFRRFRSNGLWSLTSSKSCTLPRGRGQARTPNRQSGHNRFPKRQDRRRIGPPSSGYDAHKRTSKGASGIFWWIL